MSMAFCFLNDVICWTFFLALICLRLNQSKHHSQQVLPFRCTLGLPYLILLNFELLWGVYSIFCSPALTSRLLSISYLSTCTSQLLSTGLLSNSYYDIFVVLLITVFCSFVIQFFLFTHSPMPIGAETKMTSPQQGLILSILAVTLSPGVLRNKEQQLVLLLRRSIALLLILLLN